MKKSSQNSFGNGLRTDLSPLNTPNNILTDAVNTTLVTYNGNEFILQSLIGNAKIQNLDLNGGIESFTKITPIAAKEYNGTLYIILKGTLGASKVVGVGSYKGELDKFEPNKFQFLQNLYKNNSNTPDYFLTENLLLSDEIDLEIQEAVDLSVNLIINDSKNGIYLINSGTGDSLNSFIGKYIDDNTLTQQLSLTKNITTLGKCNFTGVNEGGNLPVGTYFFYFKYIDGLDNESSIFAQEGPIMLYIGSPLRGIESIRGGLADENSNKSISLKLENLDPNFESVAIYYSRETSDLKESLITSYKKITNPFKFIGDNAQIIITGLEETEDITYDQLNIGQQEIKTCKSITQSNGYLFGANLDNSTDKDTELRNLANKITLQETRDSSDNIGNLSLYKATGGFSYDTIEITDEAHYIREVLIRIENKASKNIAFVLTKDLHFGLDNTEYHNKLKLIENKPFEGILHGNGFKITVDTNTTKGGLFPYCKKATIRDLTLDITVFTESVTVYWQNGYTHWKYNDGSEFKSKDLEISALSNLIESTALERVVINSFIHHQPITFSANSGWDNSKHSTTVVGGYGYYRTAGLTYLNLINKSDVFSKLTDVSVNFSTKTFSYKDLKPQSGNTTSIPPGNMGSSVDISLINSINNTEVNNLIVDYTLNGVIDTIQCYPITYLRVLSDGVNNNYSNIICGEIIANYAGVGLPQVPGFIGPLVPTIFAFPESANGNRIPTSSVSNIGYFKIFSYNNSATELIAAYNKLSKLTGDWSNDRISELSTYLLDSNLNLLYNSVNNKTYNTCTFIKYSPESDDFNPPDDSFEYFSPENLTNKLGYWADEYYRFGIQFIDTLGHRTNVYDIKGLVDNSENDFGVFKTTNASPITDKGIIPIGFKPVLNTSVINSLKALGIKGYTILRQPRIPTILCQGLTISKLKESGLPFFKFFESIQGGDLKQLNTEVNFLQNTTTDELQVKVGGIISPDLNLNSEYYTGIFTGASFNMVTLPYNIASFAQSLNVENRLFYSNAYENISPVSKLIEALYIPENCHGLNVKDSVFRTVAGDAKLNYAYEFLDKPTNYDFRFLRGDYSAYLGLINGGLFSGSPELYNKLVNIDNKKSVNDEITIRSQDNNAYYPVSKARAFEDVTTIYKGDCFIGAYYQRINKNFITADAPFQDGIIKKELTFTAEATPNSAGYGKPDDFKDVNLADLNAVRMGQWVGFKCCSNVNHILRTLDVTRPSERALFSKSGEGGEFTGARGFYPYYEATSAPYNKLLDSTTMNSGYNRTLSRLSSFNLAPKYSLKKEFPTRVFYSRRHFGSSLINNYRIFDLLAYRDYPTNMGSIVKIVDLFGNLLIVFERGIGLAPIQERVAMGGGDGGNLFINSSQILPERLYILSDKYGSTHPTSVIRTPFGVYGVDLEQRKIWRTNGKTFELISDFTIQKLLNDTFVNIENLNYTFNNSIVSFLHPYKNEVYFSFNLFDLKKNNKDFGIIYSEVAKCWSTKTKWSVPITTVYKNNLVTLRKDRTEEDTGEYFCWEHGVMKSLNRLPGKFFNKQDSTEIEFIVGADSINTQKIFENLKLISNNYFPSIIEYSITQGAYNPVDPEIEIGTSQTLLDMRKHGRVKGNAMYKENILNVVIKALPPKVQFPNWSGSSNVANIKREARIRDKYLRVKLTYDNSDVITLHSVITLFTPSFS